MSLQYYLVRIHMCKVYLRVRGGHPAAFTLDMEGIGDGEAAGKGDEIGYELALAW